MIHKSASNLQKTGDLKRQLADASKILEALIKVRGHFQDRVTQIDKSLEVQQKTTKGKPIYRLGEHTPSWMQRLARDALVLYYSLRLIDSI